MRLSWWHRSCQDIHGPIGAKLNAVLDGEAAIRMAIPRQLEMGTDRGLQEAFGFSLFFAPHGLSPLHTMPPVIAARLRVHQAVISACESAKTMSGRRSLPTR